MASVVLQPVPNGLDAALMSLLQNFSDAIGELQNPGSPTQAFTIDTAADLLAQAPAVNYRGAFAIVTDVPCLAISVETSPGVWAWKRADGSAL